MEDFHRQKRDLVIPKVGVKEDYLVQMHLEVVLQGLMMASKIKQNNLLKT
jgi:hypothetical protein